MNFNEFGTFSMNHALRVDFGWCFFIATILRKVSVSRSPIALSALPDLFEFEKLTQGGLPKMTSVFGRARISSIDAKSSIFLTSHLRLKFELKVSMAGRQ